jgi:hypothetical protein
VVGVTLFFVAHLAGFYALALALGSTLLLALAFYLWIAVFNMMIVAQCWAFANDLYSDEAGQRLFPLLGVGPSVGALAGAAVAKTLIGRVGAMQMMPIAAAILLASAGMSQWGHTRVRAGDAASAALVFVGVGQLGMPVRGIAVVNVMLVAGWVLPARSIVAERARLARGEYTPWKPATPLG